MLKLSFSFKIFILLILFFSSSCSILNFKKSHSNMKIEKIIYQYGDASVPPRYHRSYTISLTPDSVEIVVDSYGSIISEKKYSVTESKFEKIVVSLNNNEIKNCQKKENKGCTGGTSEHISYFSSTEELFSGYVYHCGGDNYGDLCGNTKNFGNEMRKLIVDLDSLLKK